MYRSVVTIITNAQSPLDNLLKLFWEHADNESMEVSPRTTNSSLGINERGFTLPEVLITIVIMGILFAIASSTWFSVVESRRVNAATNQIVADMRLAHSKSVNGLASWRVVLVPDVGPEADGPDYYLVKMTSGASPVVDTGVPSIERTLPDDTRIDAGFADDAVVRALYSVLGVDPGRATRSVEFDADGSMDNYSGAGAGRDTITVTQDGSPNGTIQFNEQTSRVRVD